MSEKRRVVQTESGHYAVQHWHEPGFFARVLWFGKGMPEGEWRYSEWTRGGYDAYLEVRHESRPYAYGTAAEAFERIDRMEGRWKEPERPPLRVVSREARI